AEAVGIEEIADERHVDLAEEEIDQRAAHHVEGEAGELAEAARREPKARPPWAARPEDEDADRGVGELLGDEAPDAEPEQGTADADKAAGADRQHGALGESREFEAAAEHRLMDADERRADRKRREPAQHRR